MNELRELYQQVILDHNKNPRNFGILELPTLKAVGHNPLCGDHIEVSMDVEDGIIKDIKFNGAGCAISKASASIMTTLLIGKTVDEAKSMFDEFHEIVTSDPESDALAVCCPPSPISPAPSSFVPAGPAAISLCRLDGLVAVTIAVSKVISRLKYISRRHWSNVVIPNFE